MNNSTSAHLVLTVSEDRIPTFFQLLAQGFLIRVHPGCSVREVICVEMGVPEDYFRGEVKTLFLDGKVVTDPEGVFPGDGSVLALSAAMPGAAGMMLRRDTRREPVERRTSGDEKAKIPPDRTGFILVKFFNLVQRDLGPRVFRQGMLISRENWLDFLRRRQREIRRACRTVLLDGEEIDPAGIRDLIGRQEKVFLRLETGQGSRPG